ncbi:MAG: cytochrome c biogenesis CcdA family protein [Candidatus Doudnabacteria bacterium]
MKKQLLTTLLLTVLLIFGFVIVFQRFSGSSEWLWEISNQGRFLFPLVTASALIDSINPCAFSILIVSIIFLFGLGRKPGQVLKLGLVYILGIYAVYLLIGLGILNALHIFGVPHLMSKVGSLLLIIFGILNIFEILFPKFPIKLAVPHSAHTKMNELLERVSIPGMFLLGALVGLCEFPCTGGPYLSIIGLLHDVRTYWRGVVYLFYYNIIFVLPLVLILLIANNQSLVEKVKEIQKENKKTMKLVAGFLMIILAFIILAI